ncbi:MAG: NUDIX hydrolase [Spirochaetota bacterium]|nr:NUDIX hydrolase [Spirochaetota bacterium]
MGNDANRNIRPAATVILARDAEEGIEVFMLLRNPKSEFGGGLYVFPGGSVDDLDKHPDIAALCYGMSDKEASVCLGISEGGLAYWVAAIRECYEEAGLLAAVDDQGEYISLESPLNNRRFEDYRNAICNGMTDMVKICCNEGLRLAVDRFVYFSHWITPEGAPRRYDTRFFIGIAPPQQRGLHDKRETVAHLWIRPVEALARYKRGEFCMVLPTIRQLEALSGISSTVEMMEIARSREHIPTIMPRFVKNGSGIKIVIPGDKEYL